MADKPTPSPTPTPTPTPPAKKGGVTTDETTTQPIKTNEAGQQLHKDGYPLAYTARAMALAAAGKSADPEEIVSAEDIAAHDPKAAEADREAVATYHADKAAEAAATEKE